MGLSLVKRLLTAKKGIKDYKRMMLYGKYTWFILLSVVPIDE